MTIERIKLDNGKIGVYRRCKKTWDKKIPNIDHLTPYERYCFLKHFYKDFADNTNRAYPKEELLDREAMVNVGLLFTACLLLYNLIINGDMERAAYGMFAGLILITLIIVVPLPRSYDPRDKFFRLNDVPDWKQYEKDHKKTGANLLSQDVVAIRALQVTEEEYRYLKAIDSLDGRWYEGLVEIESLKKALSYATHYANMKEKQEKEQE